MFTGPVLTGAELTSLNPVIPINAFWIEKDTGFVKRGTGATWTATDYWDPNGAQQLERVAGRMAVRGAAGEYWVAPMGRTTTALVDGVLYTHAIYVPNTIRFDRIGAEITTGAASSTLTLGVYADSGGKPTGTALLDAGTIDGNSATAQEISAGRQLRGGAVYHLAALCAGGTPTARTTVNGAGGGPGRTASLATALGATAASAGWSQTGVVGTALPTIGSLVSIATVPLVAIRLA